MKIKVSIPKRKTPSGNNIIVFLGVAWNSSGMILTIPLVKIYIGFNKTKHEKAKA